jgi:hypothetical protein
MQTARSKVLLYPYFTILFGGFAGKLWSNPLTQQSEFRAPLTYNIGSMYMMSRMVLGHKTWFGKN